jgi:molybdate transport system ATP-binding protein
VTSPLTVSFRLARPDHGGFALDVAFAAPPGITALVGPSGAGKSTVLAAIAGLLRPDAGRVALGDEVWFERAAGRAPALDRAIHRRGVAFVFQSLALFPHMTALGNVEYGVDRALPPPERRARALAALEQTRVAHLAQRRPATFSGGEAQRVALARALARSPAVVLLDEPFSALDRDLRRELARDLRRLADALAVPVLHVTHHRGELRALADRVVALEAGRVVGVGSVDEMVPAGDGEG